MSNIETGQVARTGKDCCYDGARLLLRDPQKDLAGPFVACLGGTETFGKFLERPFPDRLEQKAGLPCVNLGWPNAGLEVLLRDQVLLDCANRARLCVLEVPCAINMSNPFYQVHPRRNDRFLQASEALHALFDDVDFTEFNFTRHLLGHLRQLSKRRFAFVRYELSRAWLAGMQAVLDRIEVPVILLWLSARRPDECSDTPDLGADPALVSQQMLAELRPCVSAIIEVRADGLAGNSLGATAHEAAANALAPYVLDSAAKEKGPP